MQPTLFIIGCFNLGVTIAVFFVAGATNTDMILAAIAWASTLICLVGIGIIAAVERAGENAEAVADALRRIIERRVPR